MELCAGVALSGARGRHLRPATGNLTPLPSYQQISFYMRQHSNSSGAMEEAVQELCFYDQRKDSTCFVFP